MPQMKPYFDTIVYIYIIYTEYIYVLLHWKPTALYSH